jgi:hypothetical protein
MEQKMTHDETLQDEFEKETGLCWDSGMAYCNFGGHIELLQYAEWKSKRALTNKQIKIIIDIFENYVDPNLFEMSGSDEVVRWLDGIKSEVNK